MLLVFLLPPLATWLPRLVSGKADDDKRRHGSKSRPPTAGWTRSSSIRTRAGRFPPVIVLMDIWGLREELFDIARQHRDRVGYHCTVPNFWYRRGKVRFEYRDENGRMNSLHVTCRRQCRTRCMPTCAT